MSSLNKTAFTAPVAQKQGIALPVFSAISSAFASLVVFISLNIPLASLSGESLTRSLYVASMKLGSTIALILGSLGLFNFIISCLSAYKSGVLVRFLNASLNLVAGSTALLFVYAVQQDPAIHNAVTSGSESLVFVLLNTAAIVLLALAFFAGGANEM